jgi:uncharacterized protein (DUF433 family)
LCGKIIIESRDALGFAWSWIQDRKERGTMNMPGFDRITVDPQIMAAKPCIRGMRITVALVLNLLAGGMTSEEVIRDYPYLEPEDIHQVLQYAAWLADERIIPLELAA